MPSAVLAFSVSVTRQDNIEDKPGARMHTCAGRSAVRAAGRYPPGPSAVQPRLDPGHPAACGPVANPGLDAPLHCPGCVAVSPLLLRSATHAVSRRCPGPSAAGCLLLFKDVAHPCAAHVEAGSMQCASTAHVEQ